MEILNKTITLLRKKTVFGKPFVSSKNRPKPINTTNTQGTVKDKYLSTCVHDDALKRHKEGKSMFISLYWDKIFFNNDIKETRFLSNEYDGFPFEDETNKYHTRLHYYYEKGALNPADKKRILDFDDTNKLKTFFLKIDKNPNWSSMKYRERIMRSACEKQVMQNIELSRRLKKTGDYTDFIYLNFKDGYFGTGIDGKGYNKLGAILGDCRRMLTDKENNGFVLLFSAGEWFHPDKQLTGMTESVWQYIAKEFPHTQKNLPDPVLNPHVKSLQDNIFDIFKVIDDVNKNHKIINNNADDSSKKTLNLKLNPQMMEILVNQKSERAR
ncbi:MAG: NADAR family protein [Alphaproteobacteria bacterium]